MKDIKQCVTTETILAIKGIKNFEEFPKIRRSDNSKTTTTTTCHGSFWNNKKRMVHFQ